MVIARAEAVTQYECSDAERVEIVRDLTPLVIRGESDVAAAGTDDDRGSVCRDGTRQIDCECRNVRVGGTQRPWCLPGPQRDRLSVLQSGRCWLCESNGCVQQ